MTCKISGCVYINLRVPGVPGDPEALAIAAKKRVEQDQVMAVVGRLRAYRFRAAFIAHILCGCSWEELGVRHGVLPDVLRRAWCRCLPGTGGPPRGSGGGAASGGHGVPAAVAHQGVERHVA